MHGASVAPDLIHHVQRKNHGYTKLHELESQVKISFDIRCIYDIYDTGRLLVNYESARNKLLSGIR